jgi:copper(I)-binding protein
LRHVKEKGKGKQRIDKYKRKNDDALSFNLEEIIMKKTLLLTCMFTLGLTPFMNAAAANETAAKAITVKTPEVRLYAVGANSAEAFMDLQNASNTAQALVAASSPVDQQTQLHKTVVNNGVATMVQIKKILIPADKDKDLKFGGIHVMLIGLKEPLKDNMMVPITLKFEDGSELLINAKVVG